MKWKPYGEKNQFSGLSEMEASDGFCALDLCPLMCLAVVIPPDRMPRNGMYGVIYIVLTDVVSKSFVSVS